MITAMTTPTPTPTPVRIIVSGGRTWGHTPAHHAIIRAALSAAIGHLAVHGTWTPNTPIVIAHGACTGTDTTAAAIATQLGWDTDPHPVDWAHERRTRPATWRQAGPERNWAMCAKGAHMALIFPGGSGTQNCAAAAAAHNIPVVRIPGRPLTPPIRPHSITVTCDPYTPALAFYTAQLGLPLVDGPRLLPNGHTTATIDTGGLHLELTDDTTHPTPCPPVQHLTFTTPDPEALHLVLARRGLTPTQQPTTRHHLPVLAHYTAPSGLNITISGPRKEQRHAGGSPPPLDRVHPLGT